MLEFFLLSNGLGDITAILELKVPVFVLVEAFVDRGNSVGAFGAAAYVVSPL